MMVFHFRGANELKNLILPRMSEARETFIEDRTRAHADHVGHGFDRMTTAAVGLLKAIHGGRRYVRGYWCVLARYFSANFSICLIKVTLCVDFMEFAWVCDRSYPYFVLLCPLTK